MFYIITACVFLLAIVIVAVVGVTSKTGDKPVRTGGLLVTLVVLLGVVTLFFSFYNVGARAVGVGVSMNKYKGTYQSGWGLGAPWLHMEDFSTQLQYLKLSDGDNDDETSRTQVSFAGGGNGKVSATVTWKVDPSNVEQLWKDYQNFDRVRDRLVEPRSSNGIRKALGTLTATDAQDGSKINSINDAIKQSIQAEVGSSGVTIVGVTYDGVDLDPQTQQSIENILRLKQETIAAEQDKKKAEAEKAANAVRQSSGLLSDAAQRQRCLDLTANWDVNKQGTMPATWNCVTAPGAGVVVNPVTPQR